MQVCVFTELERWLKGGIVSSIRQQRKALDAEDITVTDDPDDSHDVLHINIPGPRSYYHLRRARRDGTPVVVHGHVTGPDFRRSFRFSNLLAPVVDRYTQRVYDQADAVIAPSAHTRDVLNERDIDTDIHVVSNGVDGGRLDGWQDVPVTAVDDPDRFTVVNLGMVFERKGLSDFIATGDRLDDTRFTWFGPQTNRFLTAHRTSRKIAGAPENVSFPGYIEDIREAFRLGDVFFFPSHEENQGIALLEAAYCGLPIVVRDIDTYDGWLEDGTQCLKAVSVGGFANGISRLRDDPGLREELGRNAREMAADHTLDGVGADLRRIYESVR